MKTKLILLGTTAFLGLVALLAQPRTETEAAARDLMRTKLDHAQSVLEGITLENYELIANHAAKLGALSLEAAWRANDTPEYSALSVSFRRHVEALKKSAQARNLDGATLAYTKMTFSCVECHKYLRLKIASATEPQSLSDLLVNSEVVRARSPSNDN